jgi:hypothetical protein
MQTLVESSQGKAMGVEEDRIPIDPSGRPDLSYYTRSAEYYAAMHARAIAPGGIFAERTHGCWGLIAKGEEAIPCALAMIASTKPDAREDGAAILAEIGKGEGVVQSLLGALAAETDVEARDSLIQALGGLRDRAAIPALAALIEDEDADGDHALDGGGKPLADRRPPLPRQARPCCSRSRLARRRAEAESQVTRCPNALTSQSALAGRKSAVGDRLLLAQLRPCPVLGFRPRACAAAGGRCQQRNQIKRIAYISGSAEQNIAPVKLPASAER